MTTPRAVPSPHTAVPAEITGTGIRALLNICRAQEAAARREAAALRASLSNPDLPPVSDKLAKSIEAAARVHDEGVRVAGGLARELEALHRGQPVLLGTCIDDVRRAQHEADTAQLKAQLATPGEPTAPRKSPPKGLAE